MQNILFYMSEAAHFWDSMKPLFEQCVNHGLTCTVVFPKVEQMEKVGRGVRNVGRMEKIISEIKQGGYILRPKRLEH